uniref:Uncharacterized protein n=1 Tax=Timema shepardi TaxID=629360 RepID=A0A7R9ANU8_TIMSH|nr:unnamed protein product [Timema shepardi]
MVLQLIENVCILVVTVLLFVSSDEGRTLLRALHSRTSDSVLCASLQLIENMKAVLFSVLFIAGLVTVLCASLQLIRNMKAVLFSVLFIAGLVTLSCAHHCNSVCAATLCLRITSEDCAKEGGVFNPSNPHLEFHPCICCDSCTLNRKENNTKS